MSARHHHKLDKMSGYVKIVRWRSFSILLYTWSVSLFLIPFNLRSREMWNGPNWGKFERKLYRFDQLLSPFSLNSLLSRIFFFFFTFLCRIKSFSFFLIFFSQKFSVLLNRSPERNNQFVFSFVEFLFIRIFIVSNKMRENLEIFNNNNCSSSSSSVLLFHLLLRLPSVFICSISVLLHFYFLCCGFVTHSMYSKCHEDFQIIFLLYRSVINVVFISLRSTCKCWEWKNENRKSDLNCNNGNAKQIETKAHLCYFVFCFIFPNIIFRSVGFRRFSSFSFSISFIHFAQLRKHSQKH